jgi:hypothetical protein
VEPDRASVNSEPGQVRLSLVRPDGTVVGEKQLDLKASCAEMAEAVAVVIAIWERPLRSGGVPPLDLPPEAEPDKALPVEPVPPVAPPSEMRELLLKERENVFREPILFLRARWRFELGAAVQSVFPTGMPGALVDVALRGNARWGPRIALGATWWNEADLGVGHVSWTRLTAGLGMIHGWDGRRFFLDLREQFVAAALVARGRGFDRTQTQTAFDPGIEAGLRTGVVLSPSWQLWVDVGLAFWPIPQELRVEGFDRTVDAAALTGSLSVGGTFLSGR